MAELSGPDISREEPLSRHTQYGIGGPAQYFARVASTERLAQLLRTCSAGAIPLTVLGAGSNALVLDGGIRGLVVRMSDRRLTIVDDHTVQLSGGYMMPRAALDCAKQGIAGLEFGIGIPGTCGASVIGNAGAFGTEIKDVLIDCDALTRDGALVTFSAAQCGFGYRRSRFTSDLSGHVIVEARFRVHHADPAEVKHRTQAIQTTRKANQPIGVRSLGSVFKNPPGDHAGRLIEAAGLKGRRCGGAEIAPTHANFILNRDHASASDVIALMELAHDQVHTQFGVDLEREVVLIGDARP